MYVLIFVLGISLVVISGFHFIRKSDPVSQFVDKYNIYITTTDITVPFAGTSFSLNIAKNDRVAAWKIYSQIKTRVAAVKFDPDVDSAMAVHDSLYKLFDIIREQITMIPIERIMKDKSDNTVKFYLSILNDGIRPHLSKWHIPLKQYIENEKIKNKELSIIEIEKKYPQREELIRSIHDMNERMDSFSEQLLKIVKSGKE